MIKSVKVFSVVLIIIATLWLVSGVWILFSSEIGRALFIEIFLPILGLWLVFGLLFMQYQLDLGNFSGFGLSS